MNNQFKKHLSIPGLLHTLRNSFAKATDRKSSSIYSLVDCLMCGMAVFGMKYPSLLKFDKDMRSEGSLVKNNISSLYKVEKVPCDTYLRERLDEIDYLQLRQSFNALLSNLQRGKVLEQYCFYNDYYLISSDGTGMFSSHEVHCDNCCVKHHRNGTKTYYHQMLCASIVHPDIKQVIPLAPEPIIKSDGTKKNDCERNAAKRLIKRLRQEHPHLAMIFVEDALYANGPHIDDLNKHNIHYILGVKPSDHTWLFDWVKASKSEFLSMSLEGVKHEFEWVNQAELNETRSDIKVNFLSYKQTNKKGKVQHFTWVTDLDLNSNNVFKIMTGARARWKIENETFNTLKNQGYNFEHNFGHGANNLCTVFGFLMLLAFLVDQIQELCCPLFKSALKKLETRSRLWDRIRSAFFIAQINSWEALYLHLSGKVKAQLIIDTG
ncbi:transposase [bacterium SCSIO 12844]|nr:transposase [bacterium SCSIO 12844]UTW41626.1 transposase [bacterium SCSIO 12844]UTW41637.1 transposase [bacterium SCSIO 12844]UTW41671.1 transposase [bacterium SCSIO 12844]UTW41712.1 transposase [bacterium SCSIO 12844]